MALAPSLYGKKQNKKVLVPLLRRLVPLRMNWACSCRGNVEKGKANFQTASNFTCLSWLNVCRICVIPTNWANWLIFLHQIVCVSRTKCPKHLFSNPSTFWTLPAANMMIIALQKPSKPCRGFVGCPGLCVRVRFLGCSCVSVMSQWFSHLLLVACSVLWLSS